MKVFQNIDKLKLADEERQILDYHISQLINLRKDQNGTEGYYAEKLRKDERMQELLLKVVMDDKSFGYLYYCLGRHINQQSKCVIYNCVPNRLEVEYAVDFDIDVFEAQIKKIEGLFDRLDCINSRIFESETHEYVGKLKDIFTRALEKYKQAIIEGIELSNQKKDDSIVDDDEATNIINVELNQLIPEHINSNHRKHLIALFKTNRTSDAINWLGSKDSLVETVCRWIKNEIITLPDEEKKIDFIMKTFKIKGEEINKGALRNSFSKMRQQT